MALVPTEPAVRAQQPAPRPPARLSRRERRRIRAPIEVALTDLEADAVLLAGSITDVVAALAAGLWTPAHATRARPPAPDATRVADELGLTLHEAPAWHLPEGRRIAAEQLDVAARPRRERAARLAASAAAARRQGATRVLAGAGAGAFHEAGLTLATARACVERYGLHLVTPFADERVQATADRLPARLRSGRWRGRRWPAWALREAFEGRLPASLAWPMRSLGQPSRRLSESSSQGERDGQTAGRSSANLDRR